MCSETPEKTFHSLRGMWKAQTLTRVTLPSTCKCTCHRVHPFNPRLPRFRIPWNGDLLSETSTSHKRCVCFGWPERGACRTICVHWLMSLIFSVSHNHALFIFRLSSRTHAQSRALSREEWKPTTTHTQAVGDPIIPALSRPRIPHRSLCLFHTGILIIYPPNTNWTLICDSNYSWCRGFVQW